MKQIKIASIIASIAVMLTLTITNSEAQNRNNNRRPSKQPTPVKVERVDPYSLIVNKLYSFTANRMVSSGTLGTKSVSGRQQVKVNKSSIRVSLPFYGRVTQSGYSSSNPMNFDGKISHYKVSTQRERSGDTFIATFEVKPDRGNNRYQMRLEVRESGSATLYIDHMHGDSATYYGNIDLL